jgi:hypothetical protein
MKMKKVYQIKESEIFKIINNLISEQAESNKIVSVKGSVGQSPKYDGLKTLFKSFKTAVQAELRKETPYCVVNGSTKVTRGGGNDIALTLTLEKCKEEDRHWFFDLAGAIYSYDYSQNSSNTRAAVFRALGDKAKMFTGTKERGVTILKTNTVGLTGIKGIDPKNPEKEYTLHAGYVVGVKADDYSELGPEETPDETRKGEEPQPSGENPWNQKSAETVTAAAAATKATEPPKITTNEPNKNVTVPVSGTFISDNGDKAHNFKNLEIKLTGEKDENGKYKTKGVLQELYEKGINPKILDISAQIVRRGDQFTTTYKATVGPSNDGKAWMGFTSRGSFGTSNGKNHIVRADGQIDGTENADNRSLAEKLKSIGAGEIEYIGEPYLDNKVEVKQYFVQFTKPKEFPPHK